MKIVKAEISDIKCERIPIWHPVTVRLTTGEGLAGLGELELAFDTGYADGRGGRDLHAPRLPSLHKIPGRFFAMKSIRLFAATSVLFYLIIGFGALEAAQKKVKPAKYIGLAHINIATRDLEKSIRFYQDNLHFAVTERSELSRPEGATKMALLRLGSCLIELAQPPKPDSVPEKIKGAIGHFAVQVKNIEQVAAELKAKGVTFDREVFTLDQLFGGIRGAFISGPSGESIELFEYMNKTGKASNKK